MFIFLESARGKWGRVRIGKEIVRPLRKKTGEKDKKGFERTLNGEAGKKIYGGMGLTNGKKAVRIKLSIEYPF